MRGGGQEGLDKKAKFCGISGIEVYLFLRGMGSSDHREWCGWTHKMER